jgi:hypothetical protein
MTTDAQAALAAAARLVSTGGLRTPREVERVTLTMADALLAWLNHQNGRQLPAPGERLVPNEDFRPLRSSARSVERLDLSALADPTVPLKVGVRVEHKIDPVNHTPSGKVACTCGQPWPCSMRGTSA